MNKIRIKCVVVLYNCKVEESKSVQALLRLYQSIRDRFELDIILYNNSPEIEITPNSIYSVKNSSENKMLYGAYTYALSCATNENIEWLMLFDQDTEPTAEYFNQLYDTISLHWQNQQLGAIIPRFKEKKEISPLSYNPKLGCLWGVKRAKSGINNLCIAAINSGCVLRVDAINSVGGFSKEFPLDHSDYYYFHQLYLSKYSIFIMNIFLNHELSVADYKNRMTPARYINFAKSEALFAKKLGLTAQFTLKIHVILRAVKQLFIKEKRKYIKLTIKSLLY